MRQENGPAINKSEKVSQVLSFISLCHFLQIVDIINQLLLAPVTMTSHHDVLYLKLCSKTSTYVTFVRYSINEGENIIKMVNTHAPTKSSTPSHWAISVELIPLAFILPTIDLEL